MCEDNLCNDNLKSDFPLEFISEQYLSEFQKQVKKLEIFRLRTFFNDDLNYTMMIKGESIDINLCTVFPDFGETSFNAKRAFRDALAHKIRKKYRIKKEQNEIIDDLDERRNVYFFVKNYYKDFNLLFRPDENISGINYPDFVLDMNIGIELTEYRRDKLVNKFDKYIKLKSTQYISCEGLRKEFKKPQDFNSLIKRLNPTIKDGYILAYSDPNYYVHTIDNDVDNLLNKILKTKLTKYEKGHYRVFDRNILLAYSPISIMEVQFDEFYDKLIELYPNIITIYKLQIYIFDGMRFVLIDLEKKRIDINEIY